MFLFITSNQHNNINNSIESFYRSSKSKDAKTMAEHEIEVFDKAGVPLPVSDSRRKEIITELRNSYREQIVVCSVCDEFCVQSNTKLVQPAELDDEFFRLLAAPDGNAIHGAKELPEQLLNQYSVEHHFPNDRRFHRTLLSPRGIETHDSTCTSKANCSCTIKLRVCTKPKGCSDTIFINKRTPKLAIAQGNWIGHLPSHFNNMTYGTRSLLRPIQSFGRLTSYFGSKFAGGRMGLTGHMYSSRLDTPVVRSKIPISPADAPTRVLVLSPFATDQLLQLLRWPRQERILSFSLK